MNKQTIVLISSPTPNCGKDTLGSYFVKNHNFSRLAFADKLKEIARDFFYWNGEKDQKGRELLINLGTVAGRTYKENIWTQHIIDTIERFSLPRVVITDCRFINEYYDLKNSTKLSDYRIISIGIESSVFGNELYKNDISQIDYEKIPKDYIINNNYDKQHLERNVNEIIKEIGLTNY